MHITISLLFPQTRSTHFKVGYDAEKSIWEYTDHFFQIYHLILDFSLKINTIYIKYLIYISSFNSDIAVFKIDTIYFCF